jgi:hypothetical protein
MADTLVVLDTLVVKAQLAVSQAVVDLLDLLALQVVLDLRAALAL